VARTFAAIWGQGAGSIPEAVIAMWPLYPSNYAAQFSSIQESQGKGDTIHPNVLGHLQIAKAVYAALNGQAVSQALNITGESRWTQQGVVSRITATNTSGELREGRLEAYAPSGAKITAPQPLLYALAPGESTSFEVAWPDVRRPEDLLAFPYCSYLSEDFNRLAVMDVSGDASTVHSVEVPFEVSGDFVAGRQVVKGRRFEVTLQTQTGTERIPIEIPEGSQVGRIPLIRPLHDGAKTGYAVTEVAYVAFGQALSAEAVVDGDLGEWAAQRWAPVGEPCQCRNSSGPRDNRKSPDEAFVQMAFKAGTHGIFIALRGRGELAGDRATFFFDSRPPELLGTVGPYYWASLSFDVGGAVSLSKGETSTTATGMIGRWKTVENGLQAELFIPYTLMDRDAWPESGDLGLSLVWTHQPKDGKSTQLMWSEDGHEWNPRWYGVIRRDQEPQEILSFRVRVK